MSNRTAEFLAEQKRLAEAATEGPWERGEIQHFSDTRYHLTYTDVEPSICAGAEVADAEFIAAARTSVPRLIAALEAVMALHQHNTYWHHPDIEGEEGEQWFGEEQHLIDAARRHFDAIEEPFDWEVERLACTAKVYCEACMKVVYEVCEPYLAPMSPEATWQCPTIRAIEAALGGEGDGE